MRNLKARQDFLKALHKVRYARLINFAPFVQFKTKNHASYMVRAYQLFKWALEWKFIKQIPLIGKDPKKTTRWEPFYCLTPKGAEFAGVQFTKDFDEKRFSNIDHETAKVDVLLGFVYGYPDYVIEISYSEKWGNYRPDATMKMWPVNDCTKRFDFIFELERSRKPIAIRKEKLNRVKKLVLI